MKKIGIVIQARMGSSRLPGKVLMKLNEEKTVLEYMVDRVNSSKLATEVIVATTVSEKDDEIYRLCKLKGIKCFRGSEDDVLSRYYECSKSEGLDIIVRLTADCPLVSPADIDKCIEVQLKEEYDYFANACPPDLSRFPDGSDVEVFTFDSLVKAQEEAKKQSDREHVTFYFWQNKDKFSTSILNSEKDLSGYRYTVDYPEDLKVVSFVAKEIEERKIQGSTEEICKILEDNKKIKKLNSQYYAGVGWEK